METSNRIKKSSEVNIWHRVASINDIPANSGAAVMIDGKQIALFNFSTKNKWYATQNLCPHRFEMVLSRGIIGDSGGEPKIACPLHKNAFSLETGKCMTGATYEIDTYPVKVENGYVYIGDIN